MAGEGRPSGRGRAALLAARAFSAQRHPERQRAAGLVILALCVAIGIALTSLGAPQPQHAMAAPPTGPDRGGTPTSPPIPAVTGSSGTSGSGSGVSGSRGPRSGSRSGSSGAGTRGTDGSGSGGSGSGSIGAPHEQVVVHIPPSIIGSSDAVPTTVPDGWTGTLRIPIWVALGVPGAEATVRTNDGRVVVTGCSSAPLTRGRVTYLACKVTAKRRAGATSFALTVTVHQGRRTIAVRAFTHTWA